MNNCLSIKGVFGHKAVLYCLLIFYLSSCTTKSTPVYQLSTFSNPSEGGTVSPGQGEYDEGTEAELTAVPNGNWMFVEWQGDHSGSQNPDTVLFDSDKSVTALFQIAELSDNQFIGTYSFTQVEPSSTVAGEFSEGWLFEESQSFIAELLLNPTNTPNGRIFSASPLPEFGEFETEFPIIFQIAENPDSNSVTLETQISIELFCEEESILYGPASSVNASSFDVADDSEFTLIIQENSNSQCDLGPEDITFRATKIGSKSIRGEANALNSQLPDSHQPGYDYKNKKSRRRLPKSN